MLKVIVEHSDDGSTTGNSTTNAAAPDSRVVSAISSGVSESLSSDLAVESSALVPSTTPSSTAATINMHSSPESFAGQHSKDTAEVAATTAEEDGEGASLQSHTASWISAIAAAVSRSSQLPPDTTKDLDQYPTDTHGLIDLVSEDEMDVNASFEDDDEDMELESDELAHKRYGSHDRKARDRVSKPTAAASFTTSHTREDSGSSSSGEAQVPAPITNTHRRLTVASLSEQISGRSRSQSDDENGGDSSLDGEVLTEPFTLSGICLPASCQEETDSPSTTAAAVPQRVTRSTVVKKRKAVEARVMSPFKKCKLRSELFAAVDVLEKQAQQLRRMLVQIREERQARRHKREQERVLRELERQERRRDREARRVEMDERRLEKESMERQNEQLDREHN